MSAALIGREAELSRAQQGLGQGGLWTLVGPPGVGKSALARWIARRPLGKLPVQYVDLDGARTRAELAVRVLRTLGEPLPAELPAEAALAFLLGRKSRSIVFDNADDILGPLGAVVSRWLSASTGSSALVTSARRLGLERESVLCIEPFVVPGHESDVAVLDDDDGVRLFAAELMRRSARPVKPDSLESVARIVTRLEGLPLAILRAAAIASVVGVTEALRLVEAEGILDVPSDESDIRARHRTLRQAFDAVWDSLEEPELRLFAAQLSVFHGAFDLEAAAAVSGASLRTSIERVGQLQERSLLLAQGEGTRVFRYLSPVRARAQAALAAARERSATVSRLVEYFAARVEPSHADAVSLTDASRAHDHESAKDALEHALARRLWDPAARIVIGMAPVYLSRGPLDEYVQLLARVQSHGARLPRARAGALALLTGLALLFGGKREESFAPFARAARLARSSDRATALSYMGLVSGFDGDFRRARRYLDRAREVAGSTLEPLVEARILKNAANVLAEEGSDGALDVISRARACFKRGGDLRGEGFMLLMRASVLLDQNQLDRAAAAARQAMGMLVEAGDARSVAWADCILATIDRDAGRPELAREGYQRSVAAFREVKDPQTLGIVLQLWAALELWQRLPSDALDLCSEACVLLEHAGDLEHLAVARALLGAAHAIEGQDEAARLELERAKKTLPRRGRAARRAAVAILSLVVSTPEARRSALRLPRPATDGEEARSALRILGAYERHSVPPPREAVLHAALDCSWVIAPDGTHLELGQRPVARKLVELLLRAREKSPGTAVPAARLLKHAWPNQQIRREAALNRLYVALTRLRAMGLDPALEKSADGYFIRRDVSIVRAKSLADVSSSR